MMYSFENKPIYFLKVISKVFSTNIINFVKLLLKYINKLTCFQNKIN